MTESTERKLSREVLSRVRRRANLLGAAAYDRYCALITSNLRCGVIMPSDIEAWTPPELVKKL
jgi:hypothetical protein